MVENLDASCRNPKSGTEFILCCFKVHNELVEERLDLGKTFSVNPFAYFVAVVWVDVVDCQQKLGLWRDRTQNFKEMLFNCRNLDKR